MKLLLKILAVRICTQGEYDIVRPPARMDTEWSSQGSSVIMYRNAELRQYQYFIASEWAGKPAVSEIDRDSYRIGGVYASPAVAGSR